MRFDLCRGGRGLCRGQRRSRPFSGGHQADGGGRHRAGGEARGLGSQAAITSVLRGLLQTSPILQHRVVLLLQPPPVQPDLPPGRPPPAGVSDDEPRPGPPHTQLGQGRAAGLLLPHRPQVSVAPGQPSQPVGRRPQAGQQPGAEARHQGLQLQPDLCGRHLGTLWGQSVLRAGDSDSLWDI